MTTTPTAGLRIDAIDAMHTAIARADAVLALLAVQFDDPGAAQMSAEINSEALEAVRAELATLRGLVKQSWQTIDA